MLVCLFIDDGHSNRCERMSHCGFNLHFLMIRDIERLFISLLGICISSLETCLFRPFTHFLIGLFDFFVGGRGVEMYKFFINFEY